MEANRIFNLESLSQAIDKDMKITGDGFPLEIFPLAIQNLIHNAKETKGFDKDYFSAGILSVCATAIGNTVSLFNGSYYSKPILWLSIIGSRGTGKTHPLSFAKKPIEQKDNQSYSEYQSLMQEYEQRDKDARGKKPKYSKFVLKDFTPEKLAEALQYSDKGILIFQDELMRWINGFDKYKKGGDQQMYNDLFNGYELTVDRVTKEPIRIPETNVNILGGMQPEIVKQLAKNNRNEDGFLDRFLFVYPEKLEPHLFTGDDITETHKVNFEKLINNLLDAPDQMILADTSNIELFKRWQHQKAKECFNDTVERSIQAKMETYVWRLALITEMMHQSITGEYHIHLQNESLEKAILLVEYFRTNALRIQDKIMTKNPLDDLTAIQIDVYNSLPSEFKRADVLPLFEQKGLSLRSTDRFLKKADLFHNFQTSKHLKAGNYKKIL